MRSHRGTVLSLGQQNKNRPNCGYFFTELEVGWLWRTPSQAPHALAWQASLVFLLPSSSLWNKDRISLAKSSFAVLHISHNFSVLPHWEKHRNQFGIMSQVAQVADIYKFDDMYTNIAAFRPRIRWWRGAVPSLQGRRQRLPETLSCGQIQDPPEAWLKRCTCCAGAPRATC